MATIIVWANSTAACSRNRSFGAVRATRAQPGAFRRLCASQRESGCVMHSNMRTKREHGKGRWITATGFVDLTQRRSVLHLISMKRWR